MGGKTTFAEMLPLIQEQLEKGGEVTFSPNGSSMLPFIRQGRDEVVIEKFNGMLKKYDIPFYRRANGQFVLHRVVKIEKDGSYIMRGDHQKELEKGITNENIIGILKCVNRDGKKPILRGTFRYNMWAIFGPWCERTISFLYRIIKHFK